ncbi:MAG: flavodoxin domain-containing protein [Nocardioides sp.]
MTTDSPLHALLVYESMFGNTEAVAREVAAGLVRAGASVQVVDVAGAGPADDYVYDLLVVGAPTHAFSLSRPSTRRDAVTKGGRSTAAATGLREWLAALHGRGHHMAAAFDTRVTSMRRLPKSASTRAYHLLDHLGFEMLSRPTGFLVTDITGALVDAEGERAEAWGRLVADQALTRSAGGVRR